MANLKKQQAETVRPVFYAPLLSASEKLSKDYTFDWAKVTDPDHLKKREKELADHKKSVADSEDQAAQATGGPDVTSTEAPVV